MADQGQHDDNDLLERARALQDKATRVSEESATGQGSSLGDALSGNRWIAAVLRVARRLKRWSGPIGNFLAWFFGRLGAGIKFAAFRRDDGQYMLDSDGDLIFSFRRLVSVLVLTLAGTVIIHIALSAVYFYSTYFHEMVYVTGKQEIETGELYQFGGCTSLPCSTMADNGKFYLIETSLYFPSFTTRKKKYLPIFHSRMAPVISRAMASTSEPCAGCISMRSFTNTW